MPGEFLELNTKGICLFCLKDCSEPLDEQNGDEEGEEGVKVGSECVRTSMRTMMRYLRVNLSKLNHFSCSLLPSLDMLGNVDVMVNLCEDCFGMTAKFEELYEQMESIRLELEQWADNLYETMKTGESVDERVTAYQGKMSSANPLDIINASIAESLRKETMLKCSLKLNSGQPRVTLRKKDAMLQAFRQLPIFIDPQNFFVSDTNQLDNLVPFESIFKADLQGETEGEISLERNQSVENKNLGNSTINISTAISASETVNVSATPPGVNEPIIKLSPIKPMEVEWPSAITVTRVEPNTSVAQVVTVVAKKNDSPLSHPQTDPLTIATFTTGTSSTSTVKPLSSSSTSTPNTPPSKSFVCGQCGLEFASQQRLWGHTAVHRNYRPVQAVPAAVTAKKRAAAAAAVLIKKRLPLPNPGNFSESEEVSCPVCRKLFNSIYSLRRHSKVHSGERPFNCNHCGKTSSEWFNHRKHLIAMHAMEVFCKYLPKGTSKDEFEDVIRGVLQGHDTYYKDKRHYHACPYCNRGLPSYSDLRVHVLQSHFDNVVMRLQAEFKEKPSKMVKREETRRSSGIGIITKVMSKAVPNGDNYQSVRQNGASSLASSVEDEEEEDGDCDVIFLNEDDEEVQEIEINPFTILG